MDALGLPVSNARVLLTYRLLLGDRYDPDMTGNQERLAGASNTRGFGRLQFRGMSDGGSAMVVPDERGRVVCRGLSRGHGLSPRCHGCAAEEQIGCFSQNLVNGSTGCLVRTRDETVYWMPQAYSLDLLPPESWRDCTETDLAEMRQIDELYSQGQTCP